MNLTLHSTVKFNVRGLPVGKGRPRFVRMGKGEKAFVRTYTPKKTVDHETLIAAWFRKQFPGRVPWDGPVAISVFAYFPFPKSRPKWQQDVKEHIPHMSKPDVSNIIKLAEDALNKVAYTDDSHIIRPTGKKMYAANGYVGTVITLDFFVMPGKDDFTKQGSLI